MTQGLLTEHIPTMYTSREVVSVVYPHYVKENVDQFFAVKPLRIRLLGDFELLANDLPVSRLDMPRLQSLLAYLALHRGVPQSRSRIAFTLWPDSTDGQAHTNLRNLLFKLRSALPEIERLLVSDRLTLCWQPDTCWSLDVQDFEQAIARAAQARRLHDSSTERQALEEAARLYQGDLLPNCYDDWIAEERDRLRQLHMAVLERLVGLLEEAGHHLEAIRVGQRLVRLDSLQEANYCLLMRLYATRGDRAAILRTYQTCRTVLKRELDLEPAPTTRKTYQRLMQAEA